MRKAALVGLVLAIAIGALLAWFLFNRPATQTKSTEERMLDVIVSEFPSFSSEGKPVIELESVSVHGDGWYVATIKSLHPVKNPVPVRIVLVEKEGQIRSIIGPETHFSEAKMLSLNIPDSVILELSKS